MPRKSEGIKLTSYDDLFSTEESRAESTMEKVQQIPVDQLVPFQDHPFKVKDDEDMAKTVESIRQFGVLVPAIARPLKDGGYEIVSGHRRHHAAQLAGLESIPVIVRELDDDAATILMVDSNLQRENILPSERAYAYKMKLEAVKHTASCIDYPANPRRFANSSTNFSNSFACYIIIPNSGNSRKESYGKTKT